MPSPADAELKYKVYNYRVYWTEQPNQEIKLPEGSVPLYFGYQDDTAYIWVKFNVLSNKIVKYNFMIVGTGQFVPEGYEYVGTNTYEDFVWHLFYKEVE